METKVKSNSTVNKGADNTANNKAINTTEALKVNNLPVSTAFNEIKRDEPKTEVKTETPKVEEAQPQKEHENPAPSKAELKEQFAQQKPSLNLEATLKLVAELAKKTALRDRYKENIDALEEFTELQKEDVDELEDEIAFQQCELMIIHQKGGFRFSTKSPSVIKGTVNFINSRFAERMAEVEAEIVIPA